MTNDNDELLAALKLHPTMQAITKEAADKLTKSRAAQIKELARLEAEAEKSWLKLSKDIDTAQAAHRKAQVALDEARAKHGAAIGARSNFTTLNSMARQRIEADLIETSHPAAKEFPRTAGDLRDATRRQFSGRTDTVRNPISGQSYPQGASNSRTICTRLDAIQEIVDAVAKMQLREADTSKAPDLIATMVAALPAIGDVELATPKGK